MRSLSKEQVTGIITCAVLGLLALAMWTLVLSPRIATAQELKTQTEQVETANITLVKKHQEILRLGEQAPQLAQEAQRLFSRMPQSAQLPEVFRQITAAARQAGISSRNVQVINASIPESVDKTGSAAQPTTAVAKVDLGVHLATMTIEVTVSGSDGQRLVFLSLLRRLDRELLITGANTVSDGAKSNAGTLTVTGTMFVLESQLPDLVATAQQIIQKAQQDAQDSTTAN
ncbi:MAG: hypothetical protein Q8M73_12625 [Actinomycetota bacterium]|nr:hypothetical protein [Actinomycetota bacterium]